MTEAPLKNPFVLLDDQLAGTQRIYSAPIDIITAYEAGEVQPAFERLQAYHSDGYYLAGYCAYELGYILEPKLRALLPDDFTAPLLQFGVFKTVEKSESPPSDKSLTAPDLHLEPLWSENDYLSRYERVKSYISAGDVYQINLCFPMHGRYQGKALPLYSVLRVRQPVHYGGVVSLGEGPEIISLSPELFFAREHSAMTMQPMKGTIKRLADKAQDAALRDSLKADEKSQAENLMIVDLLRNDLSRISKNGSVKVPELYALETYPTLHQMTSKVTSVLKDEIGFEDIFKALFPCGSVTGAPKIRAMEIIRELEPAARGAYCGALGFIDPPSQNAAGSACFNVGIRTLILEHGKLRYNIGSGVVSDSDGVEEYRECLLKAQVLAPPPRQTITQPPYLIETMRLKADGTIPRLELHLARLSRSAQALRYPFYRQKVLSALQTLSVTGEDQKLRLTLVRSGKVEADTSPLIELATPLKVAISKNSLTPHVQETRHKVSERDFYDQERARLKALCGSDEVLFLNAEGQLCEGSFTSLFIKTSENSYVTPDITCGLLPGVLRAQMIVSGAAVPAILTLADLERADIFMGNSLRGLMSVQLLSNAPQ